MDNIVYELPFENFFEAMSEDDLKMRDYSNGNKFILGMNFLNTFYQVYDMDRNQMALVPHIYEDH